MPQNKNGDETEKKRKRNGKETERRKGRTGERGSHASVRRANGTSLRNWMGVKTSYMMGERRIVMRLYK